VTHCLHGYLLCGKVRIIQLKTDRQVPLHRLRIIGKQVKGLCELVTVYGMVCAYVTGKPGRRADGITVSQETCLPVYRASVSAAGMNPEPGPRVTGCTGRMRQNRGEPLPWGSGFFAAENGVGSHIHGDSQPFTHQASAYSTWQLCCSAEQPTEQAIRAAHVCRIFDASV